MAANVRRLCELSMVPELAKEVATQINGATGTYTDTAARSAIKTKTQVNALAAIATADATDPATTQALANECKAKINAIIAALKA